MTDIAIINSTVTAKLSNEQVRACMDALSTQVNEHFQPLWGVGANLHFFTRAQADAGEIPGDYWWLSVLDDSDTAGALGYHDLTPQGQPLGKAFAGTDIKHNLSWTTTVSHELLEMLVDPDINLTVLLDDESAQTGVLVSYEVCDACEADQFGYMIGDVLVSDFVTPAWFESFRAAGSTPFDYQGQIQQPFQLLPGGYARVMRVGSLEGWQQVDAQQLRTGEVRYEAGSRPRVGSRRERRALPRGRWMRSTVTLQDKTRGHKPTRTSISVR